MHRNRRIRGILKSNKGSSLILVAALTVVIIGLAVSLRILSGIIMASANQQLNQDQAYELATSLGNALEERIVNGETQTVTGGEGEAATPKKALIDLNNVVVQKGGKLVGEMDGFDGMPDARVKADVEKDAEKDRYVVTVEAHVGKAVYFWTGIYQGSFSEGYEKCAE